MKHVRVTFDHHSYMATLQSCPIPSLTAYSQHPHCPNTLLTTSAQHPAYTRALTMMTRPRHNIHLTLVITRLAQVLNSLHASLRVHPVVLAVCTRMSALASPHMPDQHTNKRYRHFERPKTVHKWMSRMRPRRQNMRCSSHQTRATHAHCHSHMQYSPDPFASVIFNR